MIAAFDVHYMKNHRASVAAVLFSDYSTAVPKNVYRQIVPVSAGYIPGEFYKRELPCILSLLEQIDQILDEMLIDGYVWLGHRPGFGQHLFESLNRKVPVIGVAKSEFAGTSAEEVFRGTSRRPLYITATGMDPKKAAKKIRIMHGPHRIPTLLRQVDLIARKTR